MTKINSLTAQQQQELVAFREKWLAIGLATGAANREVVTPIIHDFYKRIGKAAPQVVYCQSPFQVQIILNLLNSVLVESRLGSTLDDRLWGTLGDTLESTLRSTLGDTLESTLRSTLGDTLWGTLETGLWGTLRSTRSTLESTLRSTLGDTLRSTLGDRLRSTLWGTLGDTLESTLGDTLETGLWGTLRSTRSTLGDTLESTLRSTLGDTLWGTLGDTLRSTLGDRLRVKNLRFCQTYLWGSLDSYWIAFYLFPQQHIKADIYSSDDLALLNQWAQLAQHAFWWYPFENICFVCDRPSAIHMEQVNNRYRLHCADAPAIAFSDGYAQYYYKGVAVTEQIIMHPDTITTEQIIDEENVEVRRVMMERYRLSEQITGDVSGEALLIEDLGVEPQAANDFGTIYLKQIIGDVPLCYVKVTCPSTGRVYWLRIDPDAYNRAASREPQAAVASTWRKSDGSLYFRDWRDYVPVEQS